MATRIQIRRDTTTNWSNANPVLSSGELGLNTTTGQFKIGDGTTAWNSLNYFVGYLAGGNLNDLNDVTITSAADGQYLRWNGSAWVNDAINLGTDTVGNYMTDVSAGTGISISHTPGEGSTATITNEGVTSLNGSTGAITGVVKTSDTGTVTSTMIADGTIVNADVNASAAIEHSKLANATAGQILLGTTTTGVVTATTLSGDVTIDGAGVTAIGSGVIVNADINASAAIDKTKISGTAITAADTGTVTSTMIADGTIVNADINSSAAIALSKLASGTSAQVVIANSSGVPTYTTLSGDITVSNTGVVTIAADSVALGTDTTGNYVTSLVAGNGITLANNSGEGSTPTITVNYAAVTRDSDIRFLMEVI